jgi:hypothetical protein
MQSWTSQILVQNLDLVDRAKVKVVFHDRSGDIIAAMTDWVCPSRTAAFILPMVHDLPGNWVGSVRVESLSFVDEAGERNDPAHVSALAVYSKRTGEHEPQNTGEAIAFELIPEGASFDWGQGRGDGGVASGVGVLAIPSLRKGQSPIGDGDVTTEVAITNLVPVNGFTDFTFSILDQNGPVDYVCERLNERQTEYINVATWNYVSPAFRGSAVISAHYWNHELVNSAGEPLRELVGLGAVVVQRTCAELGHEVIGDRAAAALAIPLGGPQAERLVKAALDPNQACPPAETPVPTPTPADTRNR